MKNVLFILFFLGILFPVMIKAESVNSGNVVSYVDLDRYIGVWYEVARYPNSFQKYCTRSKATYTLSEDGNIDVLNECYTVHGKNKSAHGKAWVVDKDTNAKLKVSFFWPFSGDYWILFLEPNYEYVVVGDAKKEYLWVLSRSPSIEMNLYQNTILKIIEEKGYDRNRVVFTGVL